MEPIKTEEELQKNIFEFLRKFIHEDYEQAFVATEDALENRRETCNKCEHRKPLKDKCSLCGCPIEAKIFSCLERCPDGRWEEDFDGFVATCYNTITGKNEKGTVV
tara:strand:+ start:3574 stop:3891 length:318 start_codon:yes stop_codon:yes gene_type:complete